jgi:hypothetical protein
MEGQTNSWSKLGEQPKMEWYWWTKVLIMVYIYKEAWVWQWKGGGVDTPWIHGQVTKINSYLTRPNAIESKTNSQPDQCSMKSSSRHPYTAYQHQSNRNTSCTLYKRPFHAIPQRWETVTTHLSMDRYCHNLSYTGLQLAVYGAISVAKWHFLVECEIKRQILIRSQNGILNGSKCEW